MREKPCRPPAGPAVFNRTFSIRRLNKSDIMNETSHSSTQPDLDNLLRRVEWAVEHGLLTESAAANIQTWLTDGRYANYRDQLAEHILDEKWKILDDVFWTVIPFGTGGRRGRMYPIGCNAINERTIGESAQGLADYVREVKPDGPWTAAIAYDTRHRSREFAELCAGILVASGFQVFFIDQYRSTPELSFLIRFKQCDCGIMVTASHNPPSDNAVKVYWSNGAQLIPPHDKAVIEKVGQVGKFEIADFAQAVNDGKITICTEETDRALLEQHLRYSIDGPRDIQIIYSPLHGVGEFNVRTLLEQVGFERLEIFGPHREPNGDFPNVPGHVANPENPEVFDAIIKRGRQIGADLILATDPDCDRMGAAVPVTGESDGEWQTFNGNQLGVLLAEFVLGARRTAGDLTANHYLVTTLVTTPMAKAVADYYGVRCFDQNLVGFKWICNVIDQQGPADFVFGFEESHGYLVGDYCRDKDGAVACMLMSELVTQIRANGQSVQAFLDDLYRRYGYFAEDLMTIRMEGSDGMRRMSQLMDRFRTDPPATLGGLKVRGIRDYLNGTQSRDGETRPLEGPTYNLIFLETEQEGNYIAARPSGTEPKVKFYLFTHVPADQIDDLDSTRLSMRQRLSDFRQSLEAFAAAIQ